MNHNLRRFAFYMAALPFQAVYKLTGGSRRKLRAWALAAIPTYFALGLVAGILRTSPQLNADTSNSTATPLDALLPMLITLTVALLLPGGVLSLARLAARRLAPPPGDTHGTAQWATDEDLDPFRVPSNAPVAPGALPLAHYSKSERLELPRETVVRHTLILGPSGAGKSRSFFLWACANAHGSSFVTTDPKSELWQHTSGLYNDDRTWRFAPMDPDNSQPFNWLPLVAHDAALSLLLARAIFQSDGGNITGDAQFWLYAESAFLAAAMSHVALAFPQAPTPATLVDWLTAYNDDHLTNQLFESPSRAARFLARTYDKADRRLKGGIGLAVGSRLAFLSDDTLRRFTSASATPPNFRSIHRRPTRVFWCLNETDVEQLKPLSALFFTICFHELLQSQGSVPVTLLLDEAANIGRLPALMNVVTTARGRDIGIVVGLQALSQLAEIYGRDAAAAILDNLQTKIILAGLNFESADPISKLLGEATVVQPRRGKSMGPVGVLAKGRSLMWQDSVRRLMTPDEVRRIGENEMLVITRNLPPIRLDRSIYRAPERPGRAHKLDEARVITFPQPRRYPKDTPQLPEPPDFLK
jgi:type IV secretion system protein VirD4